MSEKQYQNWRLELDQEKILWLYFDKANETVNSISRAVLEEFNQILDDVKSRDDIIGLVIRSGKAKGFIAGADLKQLSTFTNLDDVIAFIRYGQKLFDDLENLSIPTVALIEGFCMGGGTELALACRYRIAEDNDGTRIGLPEIMLGFHPGWGGTVRLPKLIGAPMAMDLILTGRPVRAKAAKKMGIIDEAVAEREIVRAARDYIIKKPAPHRASGWAAWSNSPLARPFLANILRKKVAKKAKKEHYPGPYAVIDNWARQGIANHDEAMITEANSIGELLLTNTPQNLIRVYQLSEKMKALGKNTDFKPKRVHVIGAGAMGGDIAAWCALRGMTVTLEDREAKYIAPAIKRAYALYKKKLKKRLKITPVMDRLIPDVDGKGATTADLIIEAIYENLEAKQKLFTRLEAQAKPGAILATNTSSIPLDEISEAMKEPQRLVGIHFFNPVSKMPLVEVVKGEKTDKDVIDKALAFVVRIGRQPIAVKSSPGFLVNRVLVPYLMEAMLLMEEGVPAGMIDKVATDFGMPMGPIELADTVGLDICFSVGENLARYYDGKVPQRLADTVKAGNLGRKTGKGFYNYKDGKLIREQNSNSPISKDEIRQRLFDRMLNEAVACYREGIIDDLGLLDAGMIFGTGFAPFTGGPINYIKSQGVEKFTKELQALMNKYDDRFKPDIGWESLFTDSDDKKE